MGDKQQGKWLTDTGLPGGPGEYGRPDDPKYREYSTDPNQFKAFDRSGLVRDMQTQAGLQGTAKMNQMQARMGGASGGLRRSDYGAGLAEMGADTERAQNQISLQAAQADYEDRMRLMEQYNKVMDAYNNRANDKYKTDLGMYDKQKQRDVDMYRNFAQNSADFGKGFGF